MAVIGLDLGGTKLAGAIFHHNGKPINKKTLSLTKLRGLEVAQLILGLIADQTEYADLHGWKIESIGCCIPGIVYQESGKVWAPNIPDWDNFPLLTALKKGMKSKDTSVFLDNDRACSILGEVWQGSAMGCRHAIFLSVGTGIGAGILINGQVLRGSSDIAGAIGWLALDQPFKEKYIPCGCFEYHASGDGLSRVAREYLKDDISYSGLLRSADPEKLTARDVFDAYQQNDPIGLRVIRQAITYWGMAVANLVSLFNPEVIIFGGGVFGPAVPLLNDIMHEAMKWAQPISIRQLKLVPSALGSDAGLIGAGYLAKTKNIS
jgi:glucokinase